MKKAITSVVMVFLILASVLSVGGVTVQASEKIPVLVEFKGKPDVGLIRAHGGDIKYEYSIISAVACSLSQGAIDALKRNPKIAHIELDGKVHMTLEELPWGVDQIDAELVHPYNKGTEVKVAILDTGIDYNHPDLDANYQGGIDYVYDDNDPMDDNGHGTHCAGIVAAEDNEIGVIGVAPEVYLYAVKVLDATGRGSVSDVIAGIEWAVSQDIQIISMSLSSDTDFEALHDACDAAYTAGVLVVAAAGNDYQRRGRTEFNSVDYPARYDSVIAVGATDISDTKASFSSTGSALELAAPGVSIYSTYLDDTYGTGSGTSMACPHVVGTAALVWAGEPDLTNVEVRARLQETADDLGSDGWDAWYGYGIVDADEAAPPTGPPNQPPVADANGPYSGTEDVAVTFDGLGSYDPDGDPLTYAWDFGDGSTGTGVNPTHVYTAGGAYTVTLVVNDGKVDSEPSTTTAGITEVNDPPVADAGPDQTVVVDEVVTFDGSGSYDIDGTIIAYDWDFGDGTTGIGVTTTHAYGTAGTYTVVLTVTDNGGLTDTDEAIVTVTEALTYPTMHVASIEMSTGSRTAGRNTFVWAIATVTIFDANDGALEGATVSGHWESATSDSDSGTTDANGQVTLESDSIKNPTSPTTFTFVVDNIEKDGWDYNPSANVETSDSTTV